jgi:hypothetical protein
LQTPSLSYALSYDQQSAVTVVPDEDSTEPAVRMDEQVLCAEAGMSGERRHYALEGRFSGLGFERLGLRRLGFARFAFQLRCSFGDATSRRFRREPRNGGA